MMPSPQRARPPHSSVETWLIDPPCKNEVVVTGRKGVSMCDTSFEGPGGV